MNEALSSELSRQRAHDEEFATAKLLTIGALRAEVALPLELDDMISPMAFSARILGLDERSKFVRMNWAAAHAQFVEDADTRKVLTDHVRRTRLLLSKLDPQKTYKIWVKEAMAFARDQGWLADTGLMSKAAEPSRRAYSKKDLRKEAIVSELNKHGFTDMRALPKNHSGNPGVKAAIRQALDTGRGIWVGAKVFEQAWEDLRSEAKDGAD